MTLARQNSLIIFQINKLTKLNEFFQKYKYMFLFKIWNTNVSKTIFQSFSQILEYDGKNPFLFDCFKGYLDNQSP